MGDGSAGIRSVILLLRMPPGSWISWHPERNFSAKNATWEMDQLAFLPSFFTSSGLPCFQSATWELDQLGTWSPFFMSMSDVFNWHKGGISSAESQSDCQLY